MTGVLMLGVIAFTLMAASVAGMAFGTPGALVVGALFVAYCVAGLFKS